MLNDQLNKHSLVRKSFDSVPQLEGFLRCKTVADSRMSDFSLPMLGVQSAWVVKLRASLVASSEVEVGVVGLVDDGEGAVDAEVRAEA